MKPETSHTTSIEALVIEHGLDRLGNFPHRLRIQLPGMLLALHSNSATLIDTLKDYFECVLETNEQLDSDVTLIAYQTDSLPAVMQALPWQDWHREPGKTGRKEACFDTMCFGYACRWVLKVKTQVAFCQLAPSTNLSAPPYSFATGPVNDHPNQVINFMLTQFLNHRQRLGDCLGHASGLQIDGKGVAIAGLSGGGKSTLMLKLLEIGQHFVSNDRVLLRRDASDNLKMLGIPKQPRINPGTIVFNPRLHSLMSEAERQTYLAMPSEELRAHEEKYDADVNRFFWPDCYLPETKLDALVILNWQANPENTTELQPTTLRQRPDLIAAILKTPGVFYAESAGHFLDNGKAPNPQDYALLADLPCFELTGNINFETAKTLVMQALVTLDAKAHST